MSRGTAQRSVRVPDAIWLPAKAKAEAEGVTVTDVIVEALEEFLKTER